MLEYIKSVKAVASECRQRLEGSDTYLTQSLYDEVKGEMGVLSNQAATIQASEVNVS